MTVIPFPLGISSAFGLHGASLPHLPPPQQRSEGREEAFVGQVAQGLAEQMESPNARQKALPKSSSLQAIQFDGSPEHTAADDAAAGAGAVDAFERRAVWVGGDERAGAGSGEGNRIWKRVPMEEDPLEFEAREEL